MEEKALNTEKYYARMLSPNKRMREATTCETKQNGRIYRVAGEPLPDSSRDDDIKLWQIAGSISAGSQLAKVILQYAQRTQF